jgi:hypothetical protein
MNEYGVAEMKVILRVTVRIEAPVVDFLGEIAIFVLIRKVSKLFLFLI